jgi:pyridoxine kinase
MAGTREKTAVIVVNSQVARGSVGGRAAVFILERLGFRVWFVPTVAFPWHAGHGRSTRMQSDEAIFASFVNDLADAPWLREVAGIMTGYLGAATQAGPVAGLVDAVKKINPSMLYLCDPIIGDSDGLFQPEAVGVAIHDMLLPRADIAMPNRHELAWLTGKSLTDNEQLIAAARGLGPRETVVTSAFAGEGRIGNLLVEAENANLVSHLELRDVPHGTGDTLSALYFAHRLEGRTAAVSLQRAAATTLALIRLGRRLDADEMPLETGQALFESPPDGVEVETVDQVAP